MNVTTCDNLSAKNKFVIYYRTIGNRSKNVLLYTNNSQGNLHAS